LELETACLVDLRTDPTIEQFYDDSDCSSDVQSKRRRHKERKIGEVLDLVLKWRKLYSGVRDYKTGQIIKLTLEDAAKRLGVAKKSLDDYLLQIRFARKYGFNFQQNNEERVGVLRNFVKSMKTSDKGNKGDSIDVKEEESGQSLDNVPKLSKRSKKISKNYY